MNERLAMIPQILIVNDDRKLRAMIVESLAREGLRTIEVDSGNRAVEAFHAHQPELVILSTRLGDMDGLELCRKLKSYRNVMVLILTSHFEEIDQLSGFAAGADDYMAKPFYPRVLGARVKSMLRRQFDDIETKSRMGVGPIVVDTDCRSVLCDGQIVNLTRIEFDLLVALMERPKRVISREDLILKVWNDWHCGGHTLESHLSRLRNKFRLVNGPAVGVAVRGFGYKLGIEDEVPSISYATAS
jgi:two-component system response regulator MtrA